MFVFRECFKAIFYFFIFITEGKLEDASLQSIAHMFHVGEKDTAAVQKSAISTPPSSATSRPFACEANPCRNGGICRTDVTSPRGYQCQCSEDYIGVICEGIHNEKNGFKFFFVAFTLLHICCLSGEKLVKIEQGDNKIKSDI